MGNENNFRNYVTAIQERVLGEVTDAVKDRGSEYEQDGAVQKIEIRGLELKAEVAGNGADPYVVTISVAKMVANRTVIGNDLDEIERDCTCPHMPALPRRRPLLQT